MNGQKNIELAHLFYKELLKIHSRKDADLPTKIRSLYELMQQLFFEATSEEKIQFTTFFSRIAFVTHKFDFKKQLQFYIHHFRKFFKEDPNNEIYLLGQYVLAYSIQQIYSEKILDELNIILKKDFSIKLNDIEISGFKKKIKVVALEDDPDNFQLLVKDDFHTFKTFRVQYNIAHRNENFNGTIKEIRETIGFPVCLNLLEVEIDKDGILRPQAIVVEPDYLVDVSAISECFKEFGTISIMHILKKYLPFESTKYLMIGNIANYFLDELMSNPNATFKETFPKVFQMNPLSFALFNNQTVVEIMQKSQKHFVNLKRLVHQELETFEIKKQGCYLEPSFFSENYGIQGRLDVFYPNGKKSAIIELKSGKAYMPNRYGISQNHYTQTLLYDILVKSVFGSEMEPTNYILYSGLDMRNMRYAPVVKAQQFEAMKLRNSLVAFEYQLMNDPAIAFNKIRTNRFPNLKGFIQRDIQFFEKVFSNLDELEKYYFQAFSSFIAKEHLLAKTGIQGADRINGLANLWLNQIQEKEENYEILSHLEILTNQVREDEPLLNFKKTALTNPLANFRKGDIAILYPNLNSEGAVLKSQIFKGTIVELNKEAVTFRLRYKQFNDQIFEQFDSWNLEHDMMDMGFMGMYRGLFEFARSSKEKRGLLLSTTPPQAPQNIDFQEIKELTPEQNKVLHKAISANDYFLLWGPPGTGKTSKMLKHLVNHLIHQTTENVLVLAYTNRAVDEIGEAILEGGNDDFLRIGSKYAASEKFKKNLLSEKLKTVKTRTELRTIIDNQRIFLSTVSSFTNRRELLKLKKFDTVIIDEASQILEPHLVGLLTNFKRFILIGDHLQLPAVVTQDSKYSEVNQQELNDIGLKDRRNSLFERLFKRCEEMNWHWAFDKISHQGRMHQDIMAFPNHQFYKGFLKILPELIPFSEQQKVALSTKNDFTTHSEKILAHHRMVFIPTDIDESSITQKTNLFEAKIIGQIMNFLKNSSFKSNDKPEKSIGIITPYRAQIAQIQDYLIKKDLDLSSITIDTVERYQGGARDIIIISLCTNAEKQLKSLVSLSSEGVDRKLNVALTRAREQVIILGNQHILNKDQNYRQLITICTKIEDFDASEI